ncbi:hypothetical protein COLO4_28074 [Corchorus olitorius]|uniref:Uncharacterized protein n=1 Tax=Corchorus olitorius TaxID=93759 RepID=A0A1R3HMS6_9ROSI|nr:hypothetical protein COLO4_28074 [Corchorus olitorius]
MASILRGFARLPLFFRFIGSIPGQFVESVKMGSKEKNHVHVWEWLSWHRLQVMYFSSTKG